jgi:allantoicase
MGDGWETRRRRDLPGHDWSVIKLARPGLLHRIEVDTNHYKGNFPDSCWIDGCLAPQGRDIDFLNVADFEWTNIMPETKLKADTQHLFEKELKAQGPWSHIRLCIQPDGGVSRFRVWCALASGEGAEPNGEGSSERKAYQRAKR